MRQFAWYSPEFNVIVLQTIMTDCYISFEWDIIDIVEIFPPVKDRDDDPMGLTTWIPLGEL